MLRLEKFVASLVWGVDVSKDLQWAYDTFIRPLNLESDLDRVIILPGDFLASVPFEMLPEPVGRRLGERLEVVYTNRLWRSRAAPMLRVDSHVPALLVGVNSAGLVYAEEEVREVGKLFDTATVLDTSKASQDMLEKYLAGAGVLHFATHGRVNSADPFSSALVLGAGQSAPFWWLAKQGAKPKLLVLSACQTAESGPIYSRRIVPSYFFVDNNFASIAEYLDAPYVVATLWPVNDDTSKNLMVEFYRTLFKDAEGDPVVAMHRAKMGHVKVGLTGSDAWSSVASFRVFVPSLEDLLR